MKRIIFKAICFSVLIVILQVTLYFLRGGDRRFFNTHLHMYAGDLPRSLDIVFFGDSANGSFNANDKNKKPISMMFYDLCRGPSMLHRYAPAYHMDMFYYLAKYFIDAGVKIKVVVIPINLRSFSPAWDKNPGYQFPVEKFIITHNHFFYRVFYKPLAVFQAFRLVPVTEAEFNDTPVRNGARSVGTVSYFEDKERYRAVTDEKLREKLIYHYMYELTPEHAKLAAMLRLARLLKGNNIIPFFYITPIDHEFGAEYMGKEFSGRISENVALIRQLLEPERVRFLDLSRSLPHPVFDWEEDRYPNEHLMEKGKIFVARELAREICRPD
ncbi:MAG: hypothetical protein ABIJ96_03360 [Elusimicrobiota bacterium]